MQDRARAQVAAGEEALASCGVGGRELPGRVHHDDIELGRLYERAPVVGGDVGVDGDAVRRHLQAAGSC